MNYINQAHLLASSRVTTDIFQPHKLTRAMARLALSLLVLKLSRSLVRQLKFGMVFVPCNTQTEVRQSLLANHIA